MSPLPRPYHDLHAWRHGVPGESGVVAPKQRLRGCWQDLGPHQERAQGGHLPAEMEGSENMLGCSPTVLQCLPMSSAPPAPCPCGPAQPGMLSPLGPGGYRLQGTGTQRGQLSTPRPHSTHRPAGLKVSMLPSGNTLPRAHWGPYSQHCGVPQKTGAASPPPQDRSEGPGTHAGDRADGVKGRQGPPP